jgi:hypothetical protein
MDNYPDEYLKIYQYLFYMTCPNPDMNPFFHTPEHDKEHIILKEIEAEFSTEDIVEGLSFADIAAEISIEDIVAGLSSKDIAAEIPTFAVAEDIMRSKEFVKILVKEITDIMIERLTQQQV